jgi:hypothetical protein
MSRSKIRYRLRDIGLSAITTFLIAAMPKCPVCWMALLGSMGAASAIRVEWLRPLALAFLLSSVLALFVRSRRRSVYGPFLLGLTAAVMMYECKFLFDSNVGVKLSALALLASSVWSNLPRRQVATEQNCAPCFFADPHHGHHFVEPPPAP